MSNEEIRNQEQHRRGAQLSGNQSQRPEVYEVQTHRSKLSKSEQQGVQSYETQIQQTKVSKDEQGTQVFETKTYQKKIQKKIDQEESIPSGQPIVQSEHTQSQEVHKQPQEASKQPQPIKYSHDHQKEVQLPQQKQTIQSHEYEKQHRKDEHSYEEKPRQDHSHEKLHQESQLYGRQAPEKQPPAQQLHEKSQEHQSQHQQQFHQPERVQFKQSEQPKVQYIQQQVGQSQEKPQPTVAYEVHQAQMHPNTVQPQNIQGTQLHGVQNIQGAQLHGIQNIQGAQLPGVQMLQGVSPQTIQSGISNLSMSNTWTQPLPDAQGSVIGKINYNIEEAKRDAMSLFRAMKGAGTDKNTIVEISGNRTFAQRQMIAREYSHLDESEKRDLLRDLKSEVGGDLESLLLPLYMAPGEFDARLMEKAMYGLRNDVEVLIELLCTRTNKEIEDMKRAWKERIDPRVRLEEKVNEETKTLFGVTNFHVLCLRLLEAKRPPCATPDAKQVRADAENLYRQLTESNDVTNAKTKFVEVFTERSWAHIGAVVGEFQKISDKWTMEKAINHEFGNSNTTKALQVMAEFCAQPYDFWAKKLRDAMKGLGTDDSKTVRIVVSRCEVDMNNIVLVFGQRYGDGKNLKSWIESDTSGPYADLLSYLCGFH